MAVAIQELKKKQAEQLAKEIWRAEAALKQMKEQMKAYVRELGPIEVDSHVWDFYPRTEWQFTPDNLHQLAMDAFLEVGVTPWAILKPSTSDLKKLTNWSEDKLALYGEKVETSKVFDGRKKKA
ncbi:hypothetical protein [Brevibacillus dissolubilis]|uniref:hypothetical protein n=1 Tax=Brevibacillus dissolubilis TaxID=1844116 RepID=UPI001115B527|nr:hypothetical protein [Brevibacillus dissolubilis]